MRIADRHRVEGDRERITLVPESTDDLWHLSNVLEPGDEVGGDTHRRVKRDDEQLRDTGGEREHMYVTLEVEDVEFARFANRLRVSGVIVDCSREDQLGFHHTVNVEEHTELEVTKRWKPDQLQRLEEAEEARESPDVLIVTVEEGAAHGAYSGVVFSYSLINVSALGFLGLTPLGVPEWGAILADGRANFRDAPWIAISAGMLITLMITAVNALVDRYSVSTP